MGVPVSATGISFRHQKKMCVDPSSGRSFNGSILPAVDRAGGCLVIMGVPTRSYLEMTGPEPREDHEDSYEHAGALRVDAEVL